MGHWRSCSTQACSNGGFAFLLGGKFHDAGRVLAPLWYPRVGFMADVHAPYDGDGGGGDSRLACWGEVAAHTASWQGSALLQRSCRTRRETRRRGSSRVRERRSREMEMGKRQTQRKLKRRARKRRSSFRGRAGCSTDEHSTQVLQRRPGWGPGFWAAGHVLSVSDCCWCLWGLLCGVSRDVSHITAFVTQSCRRRFATGARRPSRRRSARSGYPYTTITAGARIEKTAANGAPTLARASTLVPKGATVVSLAASMSILLSCTWSARYVQQAFV